jgi:hypothetical protein
MHLHLAVLQPNVGEGEEPTQASRLFSPRTHDFAWNDTFTAFRPLPLKWWDDASYIAYQAGDNYPDDYSEEGDYPTLPPPPLPDTIPAPPLEDDNIPF